MSEKVVEDIATSVIEDIAKILIEDIAKSFTRPGSSVSLVGHIEWSDSVSRPSNQRCPINFQF